MKTRLRKFNPKRRIATDQDPSELERLADTIEYGGNPEHKQNPGDFGLTPPSCPRPGKTLCDGVRIFKRAEALELLREGARRGLISARRGGLFPQNIWAVTESGEPLEAQIEDVAKGIYHGYPMPHADPFRDVVLKRWSK